jgi:hypothetical protein
MDTIVLIPNKKSVNMGKIPYGRYTKEFRREAAEGN